MIDTLLAGCTFRIPFDFEDGNGPVKKYFVFLGIFQGAAISLKATTQIDRYGPSPSSFPGVVFLPAPIGPFTKPTIIDPGNGFAMDEPRLKRHYDRSEMDVWPPIEGLLQNIYDALPLHRSLVKKRREGYMKVIRESL